MIFLLPRWGLPISSGNQEIQNPPAGLLKTEALASHSIHSLFARGFAASWLLCAGFFSGRSERELLSSLGAQASPWGASRFRAPQGPAQGPWPRPGLWGSDSAAAVHGLSCSRACGILLDQGWNLCLLHRQVSSLPLSPPGKPCISPWQLSDLSLWSGVPSLLLSWCKPQRK